VGKVDEAVAALGDLSAVAEKMEPLNDISDYLPTTPERQHLHLIVQAPSCKFSGCSHPLTESLIPSLYSAIIGSKARFI
jgi:hypothetical protein